MRRGAHWPWWRPLCSECPSSFIIKLLTKWQHLCKFYTQDFKWIKMKEWIFLLKRYFLALFIFHYWSSLLIFYTIVGHEGCTNVYCFYCRLYYKNDLQLEDYVTISSCRFQIHEGTEAEMFYCFSKTLWMEHLIELQDCGPWQRYEFLKCPPLICDLCRLYKKKKMFKYSSNSKTLLFLFF